MLHKHPYAVAMDIANEQVFDVGIVDSLRDTFSHPPRSTVGEREAEHIAVRHAMLAVSHTDSFGENLSLSASWRREYEMMTFVYVDYFLLAIVGGEHSFAG